MLTQVKLLTISMVTALVLPHTASAAAATDLSLTKTTGTTFTVGVNGSYNLAVSNVGPASTDAPITVIDDLPASLGFVSAIGSGWTCSAAAQRVTCTNPGPLALGATSSIWLTVSVSSAAYPTITNSATVSYAGDTNSANNTSKRPTTIRPGRVTPPASATPTRGSVGPTPSAAGTATPTPTNTPAPAATDVFVTKTVGQSFTVGSQGSYVLTVVNAGAAATNAPITVVDNLPASLGFVSATGDDWTCSASGQTVTCATADPIAIGANSSSIKLVVTVGSAAYPTVTNFATVFYAGDTDPDNNTARRPTTVRGQRIPRPHLRSSRGPHHSS